MPVLPGLQSTGTDIWKGGEVALEARGSEFWNVLPFADIPYLESFEKYSSLGIFHFPTNVLFNMEIIKHGGGGDNKLYHWLLHFIS